MRISVCVATKNRTDMLHQLLWSLIRQQYDDWDLLIVDDSDTPVQWSTLGVYPRLFNEMARTGHEVKIVQGPRVNRIGAAYQVGFTVSELDGPLFLRVDDDSWLEPDYLAKLVELMADDSVGACGGLFLHPGQEIETLSRDDPRYSHAAIEHLSDKVNIQWFRHEKSEPIPVEHLTANILFSRQWLNSIGGFEAELFHQHRDETQATWRLHMESAKLLVHPSATAWHLRGVSGGARGHHPNVYLEDHRRFMAQRRTMKPGIHISLGHAIGDGLMATPMLSVLRRMNRDRNITVYAPWAKSVLANNPDVDMIAEHSLDAQRTVRLSQSVYSWAGANGWKGHLAEAYCRMLNLPIPDDLTPRLLLTREETKIELPDKALGKDYIVIAPWSNAKTFDLYQSSGNKNWINERWTHVIRWAHDHDLTVVQLRGSEDEPLVEGVDADMCGHSLREAFACIQGACLLVSVDTMAHHAAAAFGIPSVVLWGRSKPRHFAYDKAYIINLQGECPGQVITKRESDDNDSAPDVIRDRPCINGDQWAMDQIVCPLEGKPCMASITAEAVTDAMQSLRDCKHFKQVLN